MAAAGGDALTGVFPLQLHREFLFRCFCEYSMRVVVYTIIVLELSLLEVFDVVLVLKCRVLWNVL
jgi:hypothetical protein